MTECEGYIGREICLSLDSRIIHALHNLKLFPCTNVNTVGYAPAGEKSSYVCKAYWEL